MIQYGLGAIGCSAARTILSRDNLKLVGAVDIDPAKVGKDLGELLDSKKPVKYEETIDPVLAQKPIKTDFFEVKRGHPCGLHHVARAYDEKGEFLTLTFIAALDFKVDEDRIKISGQPNLNVVLNGTHGDVATRSIAVNAIRRVKEAAPGLVNMRDLPIVTIG